MRRRLDPYLRIDELPEKHREQARRLAASKTIAVVPPGMTRRYIGTLIGCLSQGCDVWMVDRGKRASIPWRWLETSLESLPPGSEPTPRSKTLPEID